MLFDDTGAQHLQHLQCNQGAGAAEACVAFVQGFGVKTPDAQTIRTTADNAFPSDYCCTLPSTPVLLLEYGHTTMVGDHCTSSVPLVSQPILLLFSMCILFRSSRQLLHCWAVPWRRGVCSLRCTQLRMEQGSCGQQLPLQQQLVPNACVPADSRARC
jgi:hypothetical protein